MPMIWIYREGADEDEDFVGNAEQDFWNLLAQEQKDIQAKEDKRREALMPHQPTPIPEEGEGEERRDEEERGGEGEEEDKQEHEGEGEEEDK